MLVCAKIISQPAALVNRGLHLKNNLVGLKNGCIIHTWRSDRTGLENRKKIKILLFSIDLRCIITPCREKAERYTKKANLASYRKTPIMAEKTVNYTAEQTLTIVTEYSANPTKETVEKLALELGKSTRSIVAKLSREGIYKKKEYVGKTGEKPVKKDAHADAIGAILKLTEADTDSLTKANKTALKAIFDALANSRPIVE